MSAVPQRAGGIDAVLFDLDGTLIDSAPDLGAAVDRMRTARGLASLPLSHYRHMAGAGARGMLGIAFDIQPGHPDFEAMREEFFQNYEACMTERTSAFDGVPQLIAELEARLIPWGVVTNKAERFSLPLTRAMPLFATAGTVVCGDTTPFAKPHPEPLLEAARRMGVDPLRCVYVGDDERDIVAGRAAGMFTVAATYGYLGQKSETAAWGAHAAIDSPQGLFAVLPLQAGRLA
ncbi:MAG: phosphoglycolate phosphatase [Rhodoferax sp.]|nr:phosphoglycolate phosphatase [Rhodoferax sp.]